MLKKRTSMLKSVNKIQEEEYEPDKKQSLSGGADKEKKYMEKLAVVSYVPACRYLFPDFRV